MKLFKVAMLIFLCLGCQNEGDKTKTPKNNMTNTEKPQNSSTQKIGHVVLQVEDLKKSQEFYKRTLNMETKEEAIFEGEKRVFMAASDSHHEIVLKGGLVKDTIKSKRHLLQIAIQVDSKKSLQAYYKKLKQQNIETDLKNNQISWGIYFDDPDGNVIEVYWDGREELGRELWKGEQEVLSEEKLMSE